MKYDIHAHAICVYGCLQYYGSSSLQASYVDRSSTGRIVKQRKKNSSQLWERVENCQSCNCLWLWGNFGFIHRSRPHARVHHIKILTCPVHQPMTRKFPKSCQKTHIELKELISSAKLDLQYSVASQNRNTHMGDTTIFAIFGAPLLFASDLRGLWAGFAGGSAISKMSLEEAIMILTAPTCNNCSKLYGELPLR